MFIQRLFNYSLHILRPTKVKIIVAVFATVLVFLTSNFIVSDVGLATFLQMSNVAGVVTVVLAFFFPLSVSFFELNIWYNIPLLYVVTGIADSAVAPGAVYKKLFVFLFLLLSIHAVLFLLLMAIIFNTPPGVL